MYLLFVLMSYVLSSSRGSTAITDSLEVYRRLPKLDLHAHLHGSIRRSTLVELLRGGENMTLPSCKDNLHGCFQTFSLIHSAINSISLVKRIAREVLVDFMADGVIYTEIRTTPRPLSDGTSKREYVETLIGIMEQHNDKFGKDMTARLIISIDRSSSVRDAEDTMEIVESLISKGENNIIVGIDFSGNPYHGLFGDFVHIMERARSIGLKLTVHVAEVPENQETPENESDISLVLSFKPERLGHALFLKSYHYNKLYESPIPIEIAPTSNFFSLGLESYQTHPTISTWLRTGYPFVLCTDDTGVFDSPLSKEYMLVGMSFSLSVFDLLALANRSIDFIFDTSFTKQLRHMFELRSQSMGMSYDDVKVSAVTVTPPIKNVGVEL